MILRVTDCDSSVLFAPFPLPGWPVSLLEKLGLSSLVEKWPKEILPLGAPVGHLTAR
jgi:hypothetical protein